jgi:hypothetical protein
MSAEIVHSLIKRSHDEILKCKNDIFESTIKFVDISDRLESVKKMIYIQENSMYKSINKLKQLKSLLIHLSSERNDSRQEIVNLKFKLEKLKQKLKEEKKILED